MTDTYSKSLPGCTHNGVFHGDIQSLDLQNPSGLISCSGLEKEAALEVDEAW
jgi:hypothetical protein